MEDATLRESFSKVGPIFGNQCWGGPSSTLDPVVTLQKLFLDAASFHTKFWKSQEILDVKWFRV